MDNEDKKDGRGHAPGSAETQFKKGQPAANPKGRPRGSKSVITELRKALFDKVEWSADGKMTYIQAMVDAAARNAYKGDHHQLDLLLEMFVHVSKVEQIRHNTAEGREHTRIMESMLRVYEAHEQRIFELNEEEFAALVRMVRLERSKAPLKSIDEVVADMIAREKTKKQMPK